MNEKELSIKGNRLSSPAVNILPYYLLFPLLFKIILCGVVENCQFLCVAWCNNFLLINS